MFRITVAGFPIGAKVDLRAPEGIDRRGRATPDLRGLLLAIVLIAPTIGWLAIDKSVWRWDEACYGEETVELYYSLKTSKREWPSAMMRAVGFKPPGLVWIGQFFVPIGQKIGSIDFALQAAVLLFNSIALLFVFRIGKELSPGNDGLTSVAGCTLIAAAPLFIGTSHHYLTEPMQTMVVAWFYYCALFASRWSRLHILCHLLPATAVALLAKTTTPLFCALPGLIILGQLLRGGNMVSRPGVAARTMQLLILLMGAGLLFATARWYRANFHDVYEHAHIASISDISLEYGHKDSFGRKFAIWFAALQNGMFRPFLFWTTALVTLAGASIWAVGRGQDSTRIGRRHVIALCALAQIIMVLSAFSCTVPEDWRYLTATSCSIAVLLMWGLSQIGNRLVTLVVIGVALTQWAFVHSLSLGLSDIFSDNQAKPAHCPVPSTPDPADWKACCWLLAAEREAGYHDETTRVVGLTSSDPAAASRYIVVGIDLPWCNANSYAYYAAKNKLLVKRRAYFTSLGYAEKDATKALARLDTLQANYFISLSKEAQPSPANFLNQTSIPVLEDIEEDCRFECVPFVSELGIVVFKRRQP